ncbi:Alpha/Beta hydrolase protein [Aspergillus floccosus]
MATPRREVEFPTLDHVTLRGWFYGEQENVKRPCIIMASGLAGVKEQFLLDFAERFVAAGYSVLVYDHRNWGSSGGLPRNETDPIQQARDFSDAFDYAASLPAVDASKIVFWGSSMGGGVVLLAAAMDKRIAAVVAQVPFVSGEGIASAFASLLPAIYSDRQKVKAGQSPPLVPMFASSSEAAQRRDPGIVIHDENLVPFVKCLEERNLPWNPDVTAQTCLNLIGFEPKAFIHRIAPTPVLMVVADDDLPAQTSHQLSAYAAAREPKRLFILRKSGHFDPYYGDAFQKNIAAQIKFLHQVFSGEL